MLKYYRVFAQRVKLVFSLSKFFKLPSEKQKNWKLVFMSIGIGAVNYDIQDKMEQKLSSVCFQPKHL